MSSPHRVLLDACVLFPPLVRTILIELSSRSVFKPLWSDRIFEEWRIAVGRKHGISVEAEVVETQTNLQQKFPDAMVSGSGDLETVLELPDPADVHVLAAAIRGSAGTLVTFNLRDFPNRLVTPHGIEVSHPDRFFWRLLDDKPADVSSSVNVALERASVARERRRTVLKRAKLPRFAKALEALDED
ncbi:MAG: PIN domain-containing protein [Pseudomonadota bacterium]